LLQNVAETIARHRMLRFGKRIGVAVSGGADSVCLLYVLNELAPHLDLRLEVLHLNHNLRGEESRRDAEFVRRMAADLDLRSHLDEADGAALEASGNLEQAAREARLGFYGRVLASAGLDCIAQAETVLFRFLRGAGTAGLSGIRPVTSDRIIRPLLAASRDETIAYLKDRGIGWREDSSNSSRRFARNRIRHDLLPLLEREWNPSIVETCVQTAEWARAEEEYWDAEVARLAAVHLERRDDKTVLIEAPRFDPLPDAVKCRLIRRAIEMVRGDLRGIEYRHIAGIASMASAP